jgi:translocation and assembly module TamA
MNKRCFIFFLLWLVNSSLFSQNKTILKIVPEEKDKDHRKILVYQANQKDSLSAIVELNKLIIKLHGEAYITASADSISYVRDTLIIKLKIGDRFQWAHLRKGNLNEQLLNKSGYKEKFYSKTDFRYSDLIKLEGRILEYSEDNGHPFAYVRLDSIKIHGEKLEASLKYDGGHYITFDSINIIGKTKIKKKFLTRYLRIFPGQPFSQEKIDNINKLLKQLSYVKQFKPYVIVFSEDKATLNLFLEDKKSNQIDGIVGFLPNESSEKKLLVTGELNLNLKNLFGTGKMLMAEWRKFNQASQMLDFSYFHPRLLSTNLDIKADFNLLKQDTSFLNISRYITISQNTNEYGRINLYAGLKTSRELLSSKITDKTILPPFSNFNYYIYGIGYQWSNLNDFFYPRKGWLLSADGIIGNKSIMKSSAFDDTLYNNVQLKSVQINLNVNVEKYFPLGKYGVLLTKVEGGNIFNNKNNIFFNDMYRVGGLNSLRGFNENNFYASTYAVGTIEYRFFTDETSYLLLFYNQAYVKNILNEENPIDYPLGFGAGISFSTNVGVFNFIYSLGNSKSQKLNFNLSKIHFGLISRF